LIRYALAIYVTTFEQVIHALNVNTLFSCGLFVHNVLLRKDNRADIGLKKMMFIAYAEDKEFHTDVIAALSNRGVDSVALYFFDLTYVIMVIATI